MDKTKPIIALDVASSQELNALLQDLAPESLTCKVGMECYSQIIHTSNNSV